jgi:hypothetical protein
MSCSLGSGTSQEIAKLNRGLSLSFDPERKPQTEPRLSGSTIKDRYVMFCAVAFATAGAMIADDAGDFD